MWGWKASLSYTFRWLKKPTKTAFSPLNQIIRFFFILGAENPFGTQSPSFCRISFPYIPSLCFHYCFYCFTPILYCAMASWVNNSLLFMTDAVMGFSEKESLGQHFKVAKCLSSPRSFFSFLLEGSRALSPDTRPLYKPESPQVHLSPLWLTRPGLSLTSLLSPQLVCFSLPTLLFETWCRQSHSGQVTGKGLQPSVSCILRGRHSHLSDLLFCSHSICSIWSYMQIVRYIDSLWMFPLGLGRSLVCRVLA